VDDELFDFDEKPLFDDDEAEEVAFRAERDNLLATTFKQGKLLPTWAYLLIFILPAGLTYIALESIVELGVLFSAIVALAVMNGSINSMIAWLTIRLDDKSGQALQHLSIINHEMERLEDTLDEANEMVSSFTGDLEEAKLMFTKVGVDLSGLDLEPVAEVVEKLKENKDGFNEVLDNMKDVDLTYYIEKAKGIDWDALLNAAEDVLGYIKERAPTVPDMTGFKPTLNLPEPSADLDELDLPGLHVDEGTLTGLEETEEAQPVIVEPTKPQLSMARTKRPLTLTRR
jgi:hypothetical protein